jgi:hypothetical protein
MIARAMRRLLAGALAALLLAAAFASGAGAEPRWLFEGDLLHKDQVETVEGDAVLGSLSLSGGITVVCKKTHYVMGIVNIGTAGLAAVESLTFATCTATNPCTVKAVTGEKFPWDGELMATAGAEYLALENVRVSILFAGEECTLGGTLVTIKGTAGALYENPTETFAFSPASFSATATKLSEPAGLVWWNAAFTTEATGPHAGETLTVG